MTEHLEEVKNKTHKGCKIVVNKLREGKKVWYDCIVYNPTVRIHPSTGFYPNELVNEAKRKIDESEKFRDKLL